METIAKRIDLFEKFSMAGVILPYVGYMEDWKRTMFTSKKAYRLYTANKDAFFVLYEKSFDTIHQLEVGLEKYDGDDGFTVRPYTKLNINFQNAYSNISKFIEEGGEFHLPALDRISIYGPFHRYISRLNKMITTKIINPIQVLYMESNMSPLELDLESWATLFQNGHKQIYLRSIHLSDKVLNKLFANGYNCDNVSLIAGNISGGISDYFKKYLFDSEGFDADQKYKTSTLDLYNTGIDDHSQYTLNKKSLPYFLTCLAKLDIINSLKTINIEMTQFDYLELKTIFEDKGFSCDITACNRRKMPMY